MTETWTTFWDTHSGGPQKLPWSLIFIQAGEGAATELFQRLFDRDPNHVTCRCYGSDYSVRAEPSSLRSVTAFYRGHDKGGMPVQTFAKLPGVLVLRRGARTLSESDAALLKTPRKDWHDADQSIRAWKEKRGPIATESATPTAAGAE